VRTAVEAGDKALAQEQLKKAASTIDRAASKGVIHKNNAANKVSKLSSSVSKMA
ncbi:MAG: 30S ribosomal protein S20, partial [Lachnospiraceae bacterium]|nr:30S ribosomal protein S20 [Lachnospiraceae bacterium]